MILNFSLGYYKHDGKTVGPGFFYYLFISIIPIALLTLAQLYLTHNSKLIPNRHQEAVLPEYDSETSHMVCSTDRLSRPGLDMWRSESPWIQDSYGSHTSKISSSKRIKTTKIYRDPLLDYRYCESSTSPLQNPAVDRDQQNGFIRVSAESALFLDPGKRDDQTGSGKCFIRDKMFCINVGFRRASFACQHGQVLERLRI
jgi:hypothetical protein